MKLSKYMMSVALSAALVTSAFAEDAQTKDANATEIKIGATAPLSGPAAGYSIAHKVIEAYLKGVKINGKSVKYIIADDAYNPAKTVEQTKKLVENDGVSIVLASLGSAHGMSVRDYLKGKDIPQLFQFSGAPTFNDPANYPGSTGGMIDIAFEADVLANYVIKNHPDGKIAVLFQNDEYGKYYLHFFKKSLGAKVGNIVEEESYEVANPTIKAQMLKLENSKADVLLNISTPKQAIQSLQELKGKEWKPLHIMATPAAVRDIVFKAVGFDNAKGVVSVLGFKDPADPKFANDPEMKEYKAFIKKMGGNVDPSNLLVELGYATAKATESILKKAGNDLSRKNLIKIMTTEKFDYPLLLDGIGVGMTPSDYRTIDSLYVAQFDGKLWKTVGGLEGRPAR